MARPCLRYSRQPWSRATPASRTTLLASLPLTPGSPACWMSSVTSAAVLVELSLVSHHHLLLLLFDGLLVELLAWGGAVVPLPPRAIYVIYNPCYRYYVRSMLSIQKYTLVHVEPASTLVTPQHFTHTPRHVAPRHISPRHATPTFRLASD